MRDAVRGEISAINDIDSSFCCSAEELVAMLSSSGLLGKNEMTMRSSGLVVIGDQKLPLSLEGKVWSFLVFFCFLVVLLLSFDNYFYFVS